jgi:hypothetical protein
MKSYKNDPTAFKPFLTLVLLMSMTRVFGSGALESSSPDLISRDEIAAFPNAAQKVERCETASNPRSVVEAKVGYFFFSDSKMRKIYNSGGIDLQLSGSFTVWEWLQIYGSVEYLERQGRSLKGHQKTRVWEVPLSLGLKPVFKVSSKVDYYFAIGPRYFFVRQHNHSTFVSSHVSNSGLGGFVNTGFNFFPCEHLAIDVFGEYSYKRMSFHSSPRFSYGRTIQVGGFAFGVGLGYAF